MENFVRVGVGVIVISPENKILIGKRKNSHGAGRYGFPGGHLEFGESIQECALRELEEETSLQAMKPQVDVYDITDDFMSEDNKHYITIFPIIKKYTGNVQVCEPDKIQEWEWLSWNEMKALGDNLFIPIQNFIKKNPSFDPNNI